MNYQTLDSSRFLTIAGCSAGGKQALELYLDNSEYFSNLGVFSLPSDFDTNTVDFERLQLKSPSFFWLGTGNNDASYSEVEKLFNALNSLNIAHEWDVQDGSYNWLAWRKNFYHMSQKIYK